MKTVNEVSKISSVSVRTLHYYDEIGLLIPSVTTEAGYRLYDDTNLERLHQILLFREMDFSLKDIGKILDSPGFDRTKALEQQLELLTLKKKRIEDMISMTTKLLSGGKELSFSQFDKKKIEQYAADAKKAWGNTDAFGEYEKKTADYSDEKQISLAKELMGIFAEFGKMKDMSPDCDEVQNLVSKLQSFITENYYTCTVWILKGLGQMYSAGGEMTENIDTVGGSGTAEFVAKAIECKK